MGHLRELEEQFFFTSVDRALHVFSFYLEFILLFILYIFLLWEFSYVYLSYLYYYFPHFPFGINKFLS